MTHIMMPTLFIKPGHVEEFIELIRAEVEHSLRVEPGILRFDLTRDKQAENVIHVYAVYADEAAYAFHQAQPYYQELMEKMLPLFERMPDIRMATNLLPRDADWAELHATRKRALEK
jgi:quinol monooxygenase YgiN